MRIPGLVMLGAAALAGCGGDGSGNGAAGSDSAAEELFELSPEAEAILASVQEPGGADKCFRDMRVERVAAEQLQLEDARPQPRRIMLAVDSSGSMRARLGGATKIDAAKDAASQFLSANDGVDVGLVIFGHRGNNQPAGKPLSCQGVDLVLPPGPGGSAQAGSAVQQLVATGWTPLAAAISRAGAALGGGLAPGEGVVLVVSDGVETCGGDAVAAARALHQSGIRAIVDIVGFDVPVGERAALRAVAEAGGGRYLDASSAVALQNLLARNQVREQNYRSRVTVRESNALARNDVVRSNRLAQAEVCVGNLIAREEVQLGNRMARAEREGLIAKESAAAQQRLAQRHSGFQQQLASYRATINARTDAANADVEAATNQSLGSIR